MHIVVQGQTFESRACHLPGCSTLLWLTQVLRTAQGGLALNIMVSWVRVKLRVAYIRIIHSEAQPLYGKVPDMQMLGLRSTSTYRMFTTTRVIRTRYDNSTTNREQSRGAAVPTVKALTPARQPLTSSYRRHGNHDVKYSSSSRNIQNEGHEQPEYCCLLYVSYEC